MCKKKLNRVVLFLVLLSYSPIFGEALTIEEKALEKRMMEARKRQANALEEKMRKMGFFGVTVNKKDQDLLDSIRKKRSKKHALIEQKEMINRLKVPENILNDIPTAYYFKDFLYSVHLSNSQIADVVFQLDLALNDFLPVSGSEKVMQRVRYLQAQDSGFSRNNQKKLNEVYDSLSKERQSYWNKKISRAREERLIRIKNDPKLIRDRMQKTSELAKKQRLSDIAMCERYKKAIKMNKRYNEISGWKKSSMYIDDFSQKQKATCRKYK